MSYKKKYDEYPHVKRTVLGVSGRKSKLLRLEVTLLVWIEGRKLCPVPQEHASRPQSCSLRESTLAYGIAPPSPLPPTSFLPPHTSFLLHLYPPFCCCHRHLQSGMDVNVHMDRASREWQHRAGPTRRPKVTSTVDSKVGSCGGKIYLKLQ